MERITLLWLMVLGLLGAASADAGDKKPAPRSLVEDAQLLAGKKGKDGWKGWMSDEAVHLASAKKGDPKYHYTIWFEPDKGKPSGKAGLGMWYSGLKEDESMGLGGFKFELIEEDIAGASYRAIRLSLPSDFLGKPIKASPRILYYTLDGDVLTISRPFLPGGWPMDATKIHFKRNKYP